MDDMNIVDKIGEPRIKEGLLEVRSTLIRSLIEPEVNSVMIYYSTLINVIDNWFK